MSTCSPSPPPADAVAWRGTTTAGNPAFPECGAFAFELGQYLPPTFMWDTVSGRAWPTASSGHARLGKWAEAYTQWWLEGYVTDGQLRPVRDQAAAARSIFGARPYAVWRGTIAEDRMVLTESGSPCDREVVLVRG